MAFPKQFLYRLIYGNQLNLPRPVTFPYIFPVWRRFCEYRFASLINNTPSKTPGAYRSTITLGDNEELINCALCGKNDFQLLFRPQRGRGSKYWTYQVVRCPDCGFLYRNPNIRPERLGELYADNYSSFLTGSYSILRQHRYRMTMKAFGSVLADGENRRLLDFGCGVGLFLELAEQDGFSTYGVDLSPDSVAEARKRLKTTHVYRGSPQSVPEISKGGFDVITMWSVLAHLPRPVEDLSMLRSLLTDDGVLLILTVNANSLQLKARRDRWNGFTKNHLMFYSSRTLPLLLKRAGFSGVAFAPFYGEDIESGTTTLPAGRVARIRQAVDVSDGGNMMRALAFATDTAVVRWGKGLDVRPC